MIHKIEKHANGKYLITVTKRSYMADKQYEVFCDLYFDRKFSDVKRFINMEQEEGIMECSLMIKTDLETLEITLAIVEEHLYYDVSGLESIINEIKEL